MRPAVIGVLGIAAVLSMSIPALAGGWATVRLDEPPGDVVVNEPWRFGFTVLQHDVTPNSDVTPVVRALHRETGDERAFTGRREGAEGHFVAEIELPLPGEWKWSIEPQPYGETSFETLIVRESRGGSRLVANVFAGSCAEPGEIAYPLGEVAAQQMSVQSALAPIAIGAATIDAPLQQLIGTNHAVGIGGAEEGGSPVACAEIEDGAGAAGAGRDEVVVGLSVPHEARNVGVAVLREDGGRTAIAIYLPNPDAGSAPLIVAPAATSKERHIEILDSFFTPSSLEAKAGETITWTNHSTIAHTVTGDDLAFDDSGLIDPGDAFSMTLGEPGTYRYRCGPHPGMAGEIVVG